MIRATISYPHTPGARFDLDYYMSKHMPMVEAKLRPRGLAGWSVDQGLGGPLPGSSPEFTIQASILFESVEAFQAALLAEGPALMADIPNFTDIQPRVQVNKILAEQHAQSATA